MIFLLNTIRNKFHTGKMHSQYMYTSTLNRTIKGAFPLMHFSSRADAVCLGTFFATMHFQ